MLRGFKADLHIHTCLSPCGDLKMSPQAIVREAKHKGIGIIAICDHNTAENAGAVIKAARNRGVTVLPGMEVTTREEVHICALFERLPMALKLQALVYENLEGENDDKVFGMQVAVDAEGRVLGFNRRLLIGATGLSVEETVDAIHSLRGLAIAAHIDREGFGIIGQLGFIPPELSFDAVEVSSRMEIAEARQEFTDCQKYPFLRSSDAHYLEDVGEGTTTFLLGEASFAEIKLALKGEEGRRICA